MLVDDEEVLEVVEVMEGGTLPLLDP